MFAKKILVFLMQLAGFVGLTTVMADPALAVVECPRVSMVALLSSNASNLHSQCVIVKGYLVSDPHWNPLVIFLNKDSYEIGITADSVNVVVDENTVFGTYGKNPKSGLSLDDVVDSYGEVKGTVRITDMGTFKVVDIINVRSVWKL